LTPGKILKDGYLGYEGLAPLAMGFCHLRIVRGTLRTVFLVSEVRHNPGPSVTNAIEGIWSTISTTFLRAFHVADPLLVEHYNDEAVYGESGRPPRFAIAFLSPGRTAWKHVSIKELAALAGCPVSVLSPALKLLVLGPTLPATTPRAQPEGRTL
jgi:hypothetical protein